MLPGKRVTESSIVMNQLMLPPDANPWGNVHGGTIMKLVDSAAGVVAMRHCRSRVVTARIDEMSFLAPVFIGNVVTIKASVNDTGRTSLEVGVRVESEDLRSGRTWHVGSAYLVFVSLDDEGRPQAVAPILTESPDEVRRQDDARERRARRNRNGGRGGPPFRGE
jgi:acyl-CoA hydrolase